MLAQLLALLITSPTGIFASHMLSYRLMRAAGKRPTAHTSAAVAIAGWLVVLLAAATWVIVRGGVDRPLTVLCGLAYVLAVYGALAVLYLDVVNIAETSLHMHLLLEIAWGDRPSLQSLIDRYSPERMIAMRLERLTALGQVREASGRHYLADRSALRFARCLDWWRLVLALPTSPDEAGIQAAAAAAERPAAARR
jgi:hypothetical protein